MKIQTIYFTQIAIWWRLKLPIQMTLLVFPHKSPSLGGGGTEIDSILLTCWLFPLLLNIKLGWRESPRYYRRLSASQRNTELSLLHESRKMNGTMTLINKKWPKISLIGNRPILAISYLCTSLEAKKLPCWPRFHTQPNKSLLVLGSPCYLSGPLFPHS